jgi:hypothetical protein
MAGASRLRSGAVAVAPDRDFIDEGGFADGIHLSASGQADLERAMLACPQLAALRPAP